MATTFKEYLEEQLKNPEFKKEWDAMQPDYDIARGICEGLDRLGWSLDRLVAESGLPRMTVLKMRAVGGGNPRLGQIKRIAEVLGCRLEIRFVPVEDKAEN